MDEFERAKYVTYGVAVGAILYGTLVVGSLLLGTAVAILMLMLYKLDLIDKRIQHSVAAEKTIAKRQRELLEASSEDRSEPVERLATEDAVGVGDGVRE